jgi:ketosteroid isomerase-like protein
MPRTWYFWPLVAVILIAAACTVERADVRTLSGEPPEADTTQVRRLLDVIADAFESGDLAALDTIYHEGVTVYEGGRVDQGWIAYRDGHLAPEIEGLSERRLAFEDVEIRLAGSTALVTCSYTLTAQRDAEGITAHGLRTMVFRRFAGRWRLVHSHTSAGES